MTTRTKTSMSALAVALAFLTGLALLALTATARAETITPEGMLTQLPGPSGCVAETGLGGKCGSGVGLDLVHDVVISPDGKNVYALGRETVSSYTRRADGSLSHINCVSEDTTFGKCADATGLETGDNPAVFDGELIMSPDGRHLYAYNGFTELIVIFEIRSDGSLAQVMGQQKCIGDNDFGGECTNVPMMNGMSDLELTADGRHMYVASPWSDVVVVLRRDPQTGYLGQSAVDAERCLSSTHPDCKAVSEVRIKRPVGLDISPDDRILYISSDGKDPTARDVLASFTRNADTGELSPVGGQGGCISASGSNGECGLSPLANSLGDVTVAPTGRNVYPHGLGRVETDPATGTLGQSTSSNSEWGQIYDTSAISPDGRFVYTEGNAYEVNADGDILRLDWTSDLFYSDYYLAAPGQMVISPDGRNAYLVMHDSRYGEASLRVLNRAPAPVAFGKAKRRGNGTVVLTATVPEPGTLTLAKSKKVAGQTITATTPGQRLKVKVAARGKTKRKLEQWGAAWVKARLSFAVPTGQTTQSTRRLKLVID